VNSRFLRDLNALKQTLQDEIVNISETLRDIIAASQLVCTCAFRRVVTTQKTLYTKSERISKQFKHSSKL